MEFSPDNQIQQLQDSVQELFEQVLHDEEPIFISDEATIGDVSMSTSEELIGRLSVALVVGSLRSLIGERGGQYGRGNWRGGATAIQGSPVSSLSPRAG
jgi:hypothetical protein